MAEYAGIRTGKLKLKGHKDLKPAKKHKSKKRTKEEAIAETDKLEVEKHGGWWNVESFSQISGNIAIEFGDHCYIKALDNGLFVLGPPHDEAGDPPSPEEILIAFPVNENKLTLKSGYGKYLGIDKNGIVVGRSDAVSALEQFEPLRCNKDRTAEVESKRKKLPEEELGSVEQIEINYVYVLMEPSILTQNFLNYILATCRKQFQKFQDKKMRINTESRDALKAAKSDGTLHEALLDRRSKMKADRYCK
uniref:EOG090X0DUJ n=1 Tax=Alona affinis TaxID=381656 RepID=A0A9N6WU02_9CRUS|nr:EOG090X0DUJ [Alona affinis]